VIADAAQAHGATYHAQGIGSLGDAVCYSFYPAKNLGAYGDGGAVVTNDADIAKRIAMLRDHGRSLKYEHEFEGFSCRLDGLQAAILASKLPHLERWTELRRTHARELDRHLAGLDGLRTPPPEEAATRAVHHLYVVQVPHRDAIQSRLAHEVSQPVSTTRSRYTYSGRTRGSSSIPVAFRWLRSKPERSSRFRCTPNFRTSRSVTSPRA